MSFLVPLGLALFGLALPLVLLYFLKVRNRDHKVSSLLLWAPAVRERKASALLQRLDVAHLLPPALRETLFVGAEATWEAC